MKVGMIRLAYARSASISQDEQSRQRRRVPAFNSSNLFRTTRSSAAGAGIPPLLVIVGNAIASGSDLCFAREARQAIGIQTEGRGQDLQRDIATELGVSRAIDLTHAAGAERRADLVTTDSRPGGERRCRHSAIR